MMSTKIKALCVLRGITQAELAEKIGVTAPALSKKMKLDNWREDDLREIAKALNVTYKSSFQIEDGKEI